MRTAWLGAMVLAACAARQPAPEEKTTGQGWKPVEVAEMHGRCYAGSIDRGVDPSRAKALCSCLVPRFAQRFPFAWFDDGNPVTPDEEEVLGQVQASCSRELGEEPRADVPELQGTGVYIP